uniref:Methyltransferase domain-containing protein n=1 Tax=Plectus sambesii TaxID=2011161 RepID=A0A914V0A5_9BILA
MKTNEEQYFHDIFDLLKKYEYVHSLRNIDFFLQDQWKKLPNDWLLFLNDLTRDELNQLPRNGHSHPKCPETLKSFLIECGRLSVLIDEPLSMQPLPNTICKSVKQKKRHELNHLTLFIVSLCDQLNCNRVVDIGCGLGHLLRAIGNQRPLKLVGIDSDAACCSKASTSFDVHSGSEFRSKTITANATKQQLDEMLLGNESDRTAIVSLHGCGELQPTILKWFAEADRVKAPLLIAVACCYHKMSSGKDGTSINFPLSSCCSTALDTFRVSPSSLRLACQETAIRWESQSHEDHDKHER